MVNIYKCALVWIILTFLGCSVAYSQDFGNLWNQGKEQQPFFKIQTAQEGYYKISYELLYANNAPSDFFNSEKLQLWHRGKQQAISIKSADGTLAKGDYIVFYGKKNDGWQDADLYRPATDLFNPYSSLYSDTTAYFLSVADSPNRRMDTLSGPINTSTSSPRILSQKVYSFHDFYFQMAWDGADPSQSQFVPGESYATGWSDSVTRTIPLEQYVPGTPLSLEVFLQGIDRKPLQTKFYIKGQGMNDLLYLGEATSNMGQNQYGAVKAVFNSTGDISRYINNGSIRIFMQRADAAKSQFTVSYFRVDYMKYANMSLVNKQGFVNTETVNLSLQNVPTTHWLGKITAKGNHEWIKDSLLFGQAYLPTLPPGDSLFYSTALDSLSHLQAISFRTYLPTDSTYLILTHPRLTASVQEYALYRKSPAGGSYDTMVAYVDQVMNQFSYGEKHPLGIRRFLNHLKSKNSNSPDQFFIIGQGIQLDYMTENRKNPLSPPSPEDIVPTAGSPGGDYLFSMDLDGTSRTNGYSQIQHFASTIPTGRLQVNNEARVRAYLAKVKQHESLTLDQAGWRRNVLHLSGGYQPYQTDAVNREQAAQIRRYMDVAASMAQLPYFGANVKTISRVSADKELELIDISTEVNNGTSLVTFLGHSGRIISDIWIGLVSDGSIPYNNKGKYPMLFLNGCRMGDVYIDFENKFQEPSVLLDWLLTPEKGAILCIAGSSTSFLTNLSLYIQNHYISSFMDSANISKTVGEQMVRAQDRYLRTYTSKNPDELVTAMLGNYSLHGDPAVHLFPNPKAEYGMDCDKISLAELNNRKITTLTDSFDIAIPIRNKGIFIKQEFQISVKRWYANNTQNILYSPQTFSPVREYDTVHFRIKGAVPLAVGQNTFEIMIDPANQVPEPDKSNNTCNFISYIPGVTMVCINPPKFSIVNKQPVTFVAQSSTPTAKDREFYLELDTTHLFNSPFKKAFTTKAFDLPSWSSSLLIEEAQHDSIVYYWRTKYVQPESTEDTAFSYSSFIYIKSSPEGWSQSEYPQFFEDDAQAIKLDSTTGKWNFFNLTTSLQVMTIGNAYQGENPPNYQIIPFLSYNGAPLIYNRNCGYGGIEGLYILTINSVNLKMRPTFLGSGGYYQCDAYTSPLVSRVISLKNPQQRDSLYKILDKRIQKGDYVLIMSIGNADYSTYGPDLKALLHDQFGADRIDSVLDGTPYLLLTRKGYGKLVEKTARGADPYGEVLRLDTSLNSLGYAGQITTPLIGPAVAWGKFFRKFTKNPNDSVRFDIIGVESSGKETVVQSDVKDNHFDLRNLIDASRYPYIRLSAYKETQTAVTPQLLTWQVIMQKSAEGSLIFDNNSSSQYTSFTLQEGDSSKIIGFRFKNISSQDFLPHLVVRFRVSNANKSFTQYDTLRSTLNTDSTWSIKYRVPTIGYVGSNTLEVFFNPSPGQKEEYLENNQYKISYTVIADKTNPILDVAFDGKRIINGELIAPNPTISIGVSDENKFQIRQDANGIAVDLQRPCGQPNCAYERVDLSSSEVSIYPAGNNNKFELRYKPAGLPDGKYTLRVQATDISGNLSGIKPYTIVFEIVNETSISNFLPYPNPFSSKTRFVYTLTGEIPDQIRIQILTITGKIVRQIFQDELGPLYVGTHQTDFVWDGTDEYGDQLANGLYLYKVVARKNGEEIRQRANASVDGMFQDGYGKMYILR